MIFTESKLTGAFIIDVERREDERGFFGRTFCKNEFASHGLKLDVAQCNISFNRKQGTLRGMHFQIAPKAEAKLVRCTRGRVWDVMIDLRPSSPTRHQWEAIELSEQNCRAVYIPEGFAHGFQTLEDDSEVFYQMYEFYAPEYARGLRWNDPYFGIPWPLANPVMSDRDMSYPLYDPFDPGGIR